MINKFGLNLQKLRNEKGFSLRQLARQSKLNYSFISQLENGRRNIPKPATLKKLAHGLRVPYSKLLVMSGYAPKLPKGAIRDDGNYRNLPVIGQIACGNPIDAIKTTGTYRLTDMNKVPSGTNYWLKCEGESMFPTITDGSYVLIHQQEVVGSGHVAAAQLRDKVDDTPDVTLKRVGKHNKHIVILKPDNPKFDPIIISKDNPGRIIGRAIKVEHDL